MQILLTTMLTGGFYIKKIPSWLTWIKYISFIYYGYNLLMKIEFQGRDLVDCGALGVGSGMEEEECKKVESLQDALSLAMDVEDSVWSDVLALMLMFVVVRFALYYVLKRKTSA